MEKAKAGMSFGRWLWPGVRRRGRGSRFMRRTCASRHYSLQRQAKYSRQMVSFGCSLQRSPRPLSCTSRITLFAPPFHKTQHSQREKISLLALNITLSKLPHLADPFHKTEHSPQKKNVPRALNLTLSKLPSSSPHSIKQNIHGREKERKAKNKK